MLHDELIQAINNAKTQRELEELLDYCIANAKMRLAKYKQYLIEKTE